MRTVDEIMQHAPIGFTVTVTKALEAAVAYTAGDVLSETDTASAGTDWDFDGVGKGVGGYGRIVTAIVKSESESIIPELRLYLFNVAPTNTELDDNAAATVPHHDDSGFVGMIDFPAMTGNGDDSFAIATPGAVGNLPLYYVCASDDDALYGVLVTQDAFTQTATDDMTVTLVVEQL